MRLPALIALILLVGAGGLRAQQERAAPLPPQARSAMLTLSLTLSRQAPGSAELLRFSDLSARLSTPDEPVSQSQISAYAQLAARLVEASLAGGACAREAAAPLRQLRDSLSPLLDAADAERLERAHQRLTEARAASTRERALSLARALLPRKDDESAGPANGPLRPPIEWWTVGARRFETTDELVKAHSQDAAVGGLAVYHFRHAAVGPRARSLAGLSAATISVGVATALFALVAAMLGWTVFPSAVAVSVSRLLPAGFRFMVVVIAAVVAFKGWEQGVNSNALAQREGATLQGTLRLEGQAPDRKVLFIPARPNAVPMDLASHAQAPVSAPPAKERQADDAVAGAVAMLLILAAAFVPLFLGDALAVILAARKHSALGRRLGVPALGLAMGVGLVLLAQALLLVGASQGYWLALALALVLGALWGKTVLPRLRAAEAAEDRERGQWWTPARPK